MTTRNGHRPLTDDQIITKAMGAKNGDKFRRLFERGDLSEYDNDDSRGDQALCDMLAFWTRDPEQIDRIFSLSALMRDKWTRKLGRSTYGRYTIDSALDYVSKEYEPRTHQTRRPSRPTSRPHTPRADAPEAAREPRTATQPAPRPAPEPWTPSTDPDSFISRYVTYASQRTDAPPEAHELMAVAILSSLVPPSVRLPIATAIDGWKLNLWCLYLVDSTVGRKSTVLDLAKDVLSPILDGFPFVEWDGSPQGFIQRLQDRDGKPVIFLRDEYSGLLQSMNRGGHMAGMIQTLIRAYDGRVIENIRVRKKSARTGAMEEDVDRVEDPYLVTIAASTRESFMQRATIDNVLDGFLARFVMVSGHAKPKPMVLFTPELRAMQDTIIRQARDFADKALTYADIAISPEVMAASWDVEQRWIAEADDATHPGATAASYKRLSDSILKIAALIAIDESDLPVVELRHYQAAVALGERWRYHTLSVIEELGATEFQRNCDRIMETVSRHPRGIAWSDLYRRNRRLRKRDFDEAMDALEQQERVEIWTAEAETGRPPVMVRPLASSP